MKNPLTVTITIYRGVPAGLTCEQARAIFQTLFFNLQWEDFGGDKLQWFNDDTVFEVKANRRKK